ncbi:hypothetical protein A4A49_43915 [Nicotiana attenuata]|uniref:Uncharacterized protein n=1 Tax=Nicotiana attenuata TaxID=49451 RepID=A0A1J6IW32_NICAT|nr:hypothetical protein A4A49_43915 [Nicotiana attenuata]
MHMLLIPTQIRQPEQENFAKTSKELIELLSAVTLTCFSKPLTHKPNLTSIKPVEIRQIQDRMIFELKHNKKLAHICTSGRIHSDSSSTQTNNKLLLTLELQHFRNSKQSYLLILSPPPTLITPKSKIRGRVSQRT